jgi:hypothetical protein
LDAVCELVHSGTKGVELRVAAPATDGARCLDGKIMSKTNDSFRDELTINELDAVSGGRAATSPQTIDGLTQMLQQVLQQISGQGGSGTPATQGR